MAELKQAMEATDEAKAKGEKVADDMFQLYPTLLSVAGTIGTRLSKIRPLQMKKSSIGGKQYLDYLWESWGLSCYI